MSDVIVDKNRLVFPGLAGLYQKFAPASYSFMRFATGAVLVPHGIQKIMLGSAVTLAPYIDKQMGVAYPLAWAYLAVFAESVGAICLALGLFTRLAALIIFIHMSVIIYFFQSQYGYFWTNKGYEYALLWWLLCFAIFFRGGGRYSLDRLLPKEL
ncbi:MAG TPA: DoxX family protein [Stellaceae bacterium]|nr:DoxX family protein [Stellaceae bacterium]